MKTSAIVFGLVFVLVGILGFVPAVAPNEMLLGIFHVNTAHNIVHLLSGVAALACGFAGMAESRMYFRVFGVIYALVALLGLYQGPGMLLGFLSNNMPDAWLHAAIAVVALAIGFTPHRESVPTGV